MPDRVTELLDFDVTLLEAIDAGRRPLDGWDADAWPADLGALKQPARFVGFDEAGRGALAGPVAVGCVHVELARTDTSTLASALTGLDDSKRLSPRCREALARSISSVADWGFGCASAAEIDRLGIVRACRLAARRAYAKLAVCGTVGLFDRGLSLAVDGDRPALAEISLTRGDSRSLHVAAASIVAKVGRDALMHGLAERFPGYGLSGHKGYGTAAHRAAIARLGPSAVHRRSFLGRIEGADSRSR